jgi:hypothetical protein
MKCESIITAALTAATTAVHGEQLEDFQAATIRLLCWIL